MSQNSIERWGFDSLLTWESAKIVKSNATHRQFMNLILYMAPGDVAGVGEMCPHRTPGCFGVAGSNCIFTTGQLAMAKQTLINRTVFFKKHPREFAARLRADLTKAVSYAKNVCTCGHAPVIHEGKTGVCRSRIDGEPCGCRRYTRANRKLAVRLNGTSDVMWEKVTPWVFEEFPNIQFYEYTKLYERFTGQSKTPIPKNYHLTFSRSEQNDDKVEWIMKNRPDVNIAAVFNVDPKLNAGRMGSSAPKPLPKKFFGRRIVDGDKHDLRFLDPQGVVVGLRNKGTLRMVAKEKENLFVIYQDDDRLGAFDETRAGYVQVGVVTGHDVPDVIEEVAGSTGALGAADDTTVWFECPNGHTWEAAAYRSNDDGGIYLYDEDNGDVCPTCGEKGEET